MGIVTGQDIPGQNQNDSPGSISGMVVDPNGNFVVGADVRLTREDHSGDQQVRSNQVRSDQEGRFSFTGVPPGAFQLSITAASFEPKQQQGVLHGGEALEMAPLSLSIASATTEVQVSVTNYELAEEQIKVQETQRVLGVIPNFYVTYQPDALPLKPKQKFELAWKSGVDPSLSPPAGWSRGWSRRTTASAAMGKAPRDMPSGLVRPMPIVLSAI